MASSEMLVDYTSIVALAAFIGQGGTGFIS